MTGSPCVAILFSALGLSAVVLGASCSPTPEVSVFTPNERAPSKPRGPVDAGTAESLDAACPPGPEAPLFQACPVDGVVCPYGYVPPECGGRTVFCNHNVWRESSHSDPLPTCHRDGGSTEGLDGGSD